MKSWRWDDNEMIVEIFSDLGKQWATGHRLSMLSEEMARELIALAEEAVALRLELANLRAIEYKMGSIDQALRITGDQDFWSKRSWSRKVTGP
jgi:hypothetical protein